PHQQALAAPVPMTEIIPEDIRIFPGDTFTFEVTFENGAASGSGHVGYGPEIEISLPTGVTFQSAQSAIFGPLTPVQLTPTIILRLPVGSYTPDQVADSLTITATASTS